MVSATGAAQEKTGFYKDVFMDSGIKLYDRTTLAAVDSLNLSMEVFLAKKNDRNDTLMQHRCFAGWEQDLNDMQSDPWLLNSPHMAFLSPSAVIF